MVGTYLRKTKTKETVCSYSRWCWSYIENCDVITVKLKFKVKMV